MHLTIRLALFMILVFAMNANSFSSDTARLFMARKGDHIAFFLPSSHFFSEIEKDAYLPSVIEEVFKRSTKLYDESAHKSHIYSYGLHPCSKRIHLPTTVQAKLDAKFIEIKSFDIYKFPAPDLIQEKNFVQLMIVLFGPIDVDEKNLPPGFYWHEDQVSTLLAKKYGLNKKSIEGMHEFHQNYCSLDNDDMVDTVKYSLSQDEVRGRGGEKYINDVYSSALRCAVLSLSEYDFCELNIRKKLAGPAKAANVGLGADKFLFFNRNALWLRKIIQMSNEPGIPFYAFGAAHFTANKFGPGLISLLRQAGFEITLIRSLSDLPPNFMSRPAALQVDENIKVAQKNSPN